MRSGIGRRRLLHGAAAASVAWAWRGPALAQVADGGRVAMAGAATAFLAALPADCRRRAAFTFGDKERLNWGYVPRRREGLPFKDMSAAARAAAHELMKASLSAVGVLLIVGSAYVERRRGRIARFWEEASARRLREQESV